MDADTDTDTDTDTETLHTLLDDSLARGPEFGAGMSSHLPMALHALHALGAPATRLQAFHAAYAKRLRDPAPRPAVTAELPADWRDARGDFGAFDALCQHFGAVLREQGRDATLAAVLPALWPGAAGALFHGLIRTAHAVQSDHAGELASALGYWAARWRSVPAVGAPGPVPVGFAEWAAQVEAVAFECRLPGRSISSRIGDAVQTPAYAAWSGATAIDGLQPLSDWAADLYARSGNFTVLHLVTATRAARVLWPWTTARAEVLQGLLRAATAALMASNLERGGPLPTEPGVPMPAWPALIERAAASDDDHVIKLVHALVEERTVYGDGARQRAAVRALMP